jgi:predicted nucleic acid-binding protein
LTIGVIHLDANFLIAALRPADRGIRLIESWVGAGHSIDMSAVAWSEFLCGPITTQDLARARVFVTNITSFELADAALAAELFNATGRRPRSHADCMIAAAAIRCRATLATFDRSRFARFAKFSLDLATT